MKKGRDQGWKDIWPTKKLYNNHSPMTQGSQLWFTRTVADKPGACDCTWTKLQTGNQKSV